MSWAAFVAFGIEAVIVDQCFRRIAKRQSFSMERCRACMGQFDLLSRAHNEHMCARRDGQLATSDG